MEGQIYSTCIILSGLLYVTQGSPVLIFTNRDSIYLLNTSNANTILDATLLSGNTERAISVDFLYSQNLMFWFNNKHKNILRATIGQDLSNVTELVTNALYSVGGLACDWLAGNLYWGDESTHRIEVSNIDRGHRKVLFWKKISKPWAIALDPLNGYMYCTDRGEFPRIERASMDGSQNSRTVLVDDNIQHPNGLTIDYQQRKLYWVDAGIHSLFSSDMDGAHRQTVLSSGLMVYPFSLTIFNGTLFWTDWYNDSIISCKRNGQEPNEILTGLKHQPMSINTYDPSRQPQGSEKSPCTINNGGCSRLCLTSPVEPYYKCACPTGILLGDDNATCAEEPTAMLIVAQDHNILQVSLDTTDYIDVALPIETDKTVVAFDYDPVEKMLYWADGTSSIRRAYLNGSDNKVIVNRYTSYNVYGLAIDWIGRNLYWTDTGPDIIEVARLDGSSRKIIVSDGLMGPGAICLDPAKGYIWWTDWKWGSVAKIERAYLDGSHREVIIDKDVAQIRGIAVDTETDMLYWYEQNQINVANTDGTNRRVLVQDRPNAFGLSLLGNFLYWTNWRNNIQRVHKETGGERSVIVDRKLVWGIAASYSHHINLKGWNRCADSNGGCSDLCFHTPMSTKCACPVGQELDNTELNCIVSEPDLYMLYSQHLSVNIMTFSPTRTTRSLYSTRTMDPYSIDVHRVHKGGRIMYYWTDKRNKNICRSLILSSSTRTLVNERLDVPEDLAIDWIADNLYWIDSGSQPRIEVSRLNGNHRKVLIWKNLKQPRSIAVNPINGYMYWTNGPKIERAHLDGSYRETILTKSGNASDLIIDYTDQRLYWINNRRNIIESSDLMDKDHGPTFSIIITGKDRMQVVTDEIYSPVTMALFKDYIYWVDAHTNTMEKALKTNGNDRVTVLGKFEGYGGVKDMVLFNSSKLTGTNACSRNKSVRNGGCSDLCFVVPEVASNTTTHKCSCPYNSKLSEDGTSCNERNSSFLLLSKRSAISELILKDNEDNYGEIISNIKDSEDVLPIPVRNVHSLDFDHRTEYVYWVDGHKRTIRRSRMDGSDVSTIVEDANSRPFDIVVDPFSKLLFWSCSRKNTINIVRMDNLKTNGVIIKEQSQKPRHLAVNPNTGHIFWTNNGKEPSIRKSLLDGTEIRTLISTKLYKPGQIAVDPKSGLLFWVDQGQQVIEAIGIYGENRHRHILHRGRGDDEATTIVGLTVFNDLLYFLDKGNLQIRTINQTSGEERPVIKYNNRKINDITATIDLEVIEHNPCDSVKLNCSHICIINGSSAHCACPLNLELLSDMKTCRERP